MSEDTKQEPDVLDEALRCAAAEMAGAIARGVPLITLVDMIGTRVWNDAYAAGLAAKVKTPTRGASDPPTVEANPREMELRQQLAELTVILKALPWPTSLQPALDILEAAFHALPQALAEAHEAGQEFARETVGDWLEPEARR